MDNNEKLDDFISIFLSETKKAEKGQEKHIAITEDEDKSLRREVEIESLKTDNEIKRELLKSKEQDREQRKEFAIKIYQFLLFYLSCVLLLIILCSSTVFDFEMTEAVIIALLTTTTANVISIFILVVKYLFNTKEH